MNTVSVILSQIYRMIPETYIASTLKDSELEKKRKIGIEFVGDKELVSI